jgi:hemolysin III
MARTSVCLFCIVDLATEQIVLRRRTIIVVSKATTGSATFSPTPSRMEWELARHCWLHLPDCCFYARINLGRRELRHFRGHSDPRLPLLDTLSFARPHTRTPRFFEVLDHSAIYLLIAGTYTPFTLVALRGPVGWVLFGVVWTVAIAGVIFKSLAVNRLAVASAFVYLAQGWFVIFAARPLLHALGWHGRIWLSAGGVAYTLGGVFFALDLLRAGSSSRSTVCPTFTQPAWHLFVLAGSVAHDCAILFYVVPVRV